MPRIKQRGALALQNTSAPDAGAIWRRIANEIGRIRAEEREIYAASLALFNASRKTLTPSG